MNTIEHLLTCITEECCEIGQASTKAQRFGLQDINPNNALTNRDDMIKEINDLVGVLELLQESGVALPGLFDREAIDRKKSKLLYFMSQSQKLGTLQVD